MTFIRTRLDNNALIDVHARIGVMAQTLKLRDLMVRTAASLTT
jgi:hypothetical protein